MEPRVCKTTNYSLAEFLTFQGFKVEPLEDNLFCVTRDTELPVFVNITDERIYFEMDLGYVGNIGCKSLYFDLLSANSEILPVSFAINNTNPSDPRLVIVDSLESMNLDDNELLAVFDALELAAESAETILKPILA